MSLAYKAYIYTHTLTIFIYLYLYLYLSIYLTIYMSFLIEIHFMQGFTHIHEQTP